MNENKMYYVYILASRSRNLYTGVTNNLKRRILEHKQGSVPGFARKYRTHRLVYFEPFANIRQALECEKRVKSWRRKKKLALITRHNPTWDDLAAPWGERRSSEKLSPRLGLRITGVEEPVPRGLKATRERESPMSTLKG